MISLFLALLAFLAALFGQSQTAEQQFAAAAERQRLEALANLPALTIAADEQRRQAAVVRAAALAREEQAHKARGDFQLPETGNRERAAPSKPMTFEERFRLAARRQREEDLTNLPELTRIGDEQRRKWAEERAANLAREQAAWQAQQEARGQQSAFNFSPTGSAYGDISDLTGRPKTVFVHDYYRKDGTHVSSYYRSPPRRR
jgi:hypothetical protein